MKLKFFLTLLILFPINLYSQDTVYNRMDKEGLKTGYWKSYYPNGKLRYLGYFVKGKPVGQMKKYYSGGLLQADMLFDQTGTRSLVKLYNEQGKLIAEGKYIGESKDSTWNYYSSYDGRLAMRENFIKGRKDGVTYKYYLDGQPSEMLEWKNNTEHGKWEQYYENGNVRLICSYVEGKRSGNFRSFNPEGLPSVSGEYKDGVMHGKWTFYNEKGEEEYNLEYQNGKMLPNKEYDKRVEEISKRIEEAAQKAGVAPGDYDIEPF